MFGKDWEGKETEREREREIEWEKQIYTLEMDK